MTFFRMQLEDAKHSDFSENGILCQCGPRHAALSQCANPSLDYTCISGTDRCPALSRYRGNRRELLAAYEGFLEVQGPLN